MKRSPITRRTPMPRGSALRRAAIVRAVHLAYTAPKRRGKTRVGEFPPRVRRLLFRRFNGRCAYCGDPLPAAHWTAQHRRARGMGGSSDPVTVSAANGVAVHEIPCHRDIEANPGQSLDDGFRVPQGANPAFYRLRIWTGQLVWLGSEGNYAPTTEEETR